MTQLIYLASPIDQGNTATLKDGAKRHLLSEGAAVFDPSAGWTVSQLAEPTPALQYANIAVLRHCGGLFAILKPDVLTVGVILEIEEAIDNLIPVVVYAPDLKPSWSLSYLGVDVCTNLNEAIDKMMGEARDV
jgi:hypothetical protein